MPIKISDHSKKDATGKSTEIAYLLEDNWRLPDQMVAFQLWLDENKNMQQSEYTADIGFCPREDALGGGGKLTLSSMSIMVKIGLELCMSEYPED